MLIDPHLYLAFILGTVILVLIPGPNMALIVSNSVAHGPRFGLLTLAGTSSAMIVQLILTGLGMSTVLGMLAHWFDWIRWIGVVYLIFLGVRQWRSATADLTAVKAQPKSVRAIYARGFLVSLTNPKTLLFYAAFFPQFITVDGTAGRQLFLLSVTFMALVIVFDGTWAILAGRARGLLTARGALRNKLSGGFLIGAGVGLALAHKR